MVELKKEDFFKLKQRLADLRVVLNSIEYILKNAKIK